MYESNYISVSVSYYKSSVIYLLTKKPITKLALKAFKCHFSRVSLQLLVQ